MSRVASNLECKILKKASNLMMKSADIWTEIANILLAASEARQDRIKAILVRAQPKIVECAEIEEKPFDSN